MKELPALTVLFLQPGRTLPATLKVIFPATVATAVMFFAWRNIKLPGSRVSEALRDLFAICAVAIDAADAEPLAFVAVTVDFKY